MGQFPGIELEAANWTGGPETFRQIIDNNVLGTILVAEENDTLLGLITLSYPTAIHCGGIYTCIEEFIVGEKGRGKGIGGKLLKAALDEASSRGCFELQVNNPSEMGYPVYLKYGLKDTGKQLKIIFPRN